MSKELIKFIELCLADGVITDYLSYKKTYSGCKVDILLKNGTTRVITNTYLSLKNVLISKKDLKGLGGKEMVAF